jgi:hypothetical protein
MANYPQTTTTSFTGDIVLTNGGIVGIGTTSPSGASLQIVEDSSTVMPIRIDQSGSAGYAGIQFYSSGTMKAHVGYANAGAGTCANQAYFGSVANIDTVITSNDTARITIKNTGKIAIGNAAPRSAIQIAKDAGGTDCGYLTFEQLGNAPVAPGAGLACIYLRNGHLYARIGVGNEVMLA